MIPEQVRQAIAGMLPQYPLGFVRGHDILGKPWKGQERVVDAVCAVIESHLEQVTTVSDDDLMIFRWLDDPKDGKP